MNSMTGYGKGECEIGGLKIVVELKSVNHRFLDLSFKTPKIFSYTEDSLRNYIKSVFTRGHIDIFINYQAKGGDENSVVFNNVLAEKYLALASSVASKYGIENDMTVDKLFNKPNVLIAGDADMDETKALEELLKATAVACEGLTQMRAVEGDKIKAVLLEKVNSIFTATKNIEEFVPTQIENYRTKLKARIAEALGDANLDESKFMNEIVFYTDRVAIDEEFDRLYAHIEHFKERSEESNPVGRQLDFIVQEMNREANTIASKCNDLSIANNVLQLKTDIEKVREQVQNIE